VVTLTGYRFYRFSRRPREFRGRLHFRAAAKSRAALHADRRLQAYLTWHGDSTIGRALTCCAISSWNLIHSDDLEYEELTKTTERAA